MRTSPDRSAVALWITIGAGVLALAGSIGMVTARGSDVLGSAGRPEGGFGLLAAALALFFLFVYRAYGRPRALKLAAAAGIVMLIAGLWAVATLPPGCGEVSESEGLPVACFEVYGNDPEAAEGPSTWGIWLLTLGGFGVAAGGIVLLFGLAGVSREPEIPRRRAAAPASRDRARPSRATASRRPRPRRD